ncbi:MAG: lactate racemase domain-containing protein, partial [Acidobacteriota bacterium]
MKFPPMYRVRQVFDAPEVGDLAAALDRELERVGAAARIRKGSRIAITAGSRGIRDIVPLLRQIVTFLRERGAEPFLFPAMGSHGGGTAEGQIQVLESLGINEASIGAPVRASMEVKEIGRSRYGFPVLVDRQAASADGIVVVNRIKPHTEFEGSVESGLMKMMAIGMGKHRGCFEVHKQTVHFGYRDVIPEIGRVILDNLPVLFGVGIVENVYDHTALVRAVLPSRFEIEEAELLAEAKRLMARLPFDPLDVLIVDEMGKNVSGTGMDSNVIG